MRTFEFLRDTGTDRCSELLFMQHATFCGSKNMVRHMKVRHMKYGQTLHERKKNVWVK